MSEPPIWGGRPEPGRDAPEPDPGADSSTEAGGGAVVGGRHAAHRAPRRGLGAQLQRRYVLLGSAVLGLVLVATLLFGACSGGEVSGGDPQVTSPTSVPATSESVVSDPTTRATTTTPSPTTSSTDDSGDADDKKGKRAKDGDDDKKMAAKVPVLVLNNSRVTGLAARWASTIRAEGWTVTRTDNWTRTDLSEPTLFYARGDKASARAFAKEFDVVADVQPALSGMGPDLTLVLTSSAA